MNFNYLVLAEDQPTGGGWLPIVFLVIMIAVMYFVMIRPQRKQQKAEAKIMLLTTFNLSRAKLIADTTAHTIRKTVNGFLLYFSVGG